MKRNIIIPAILAIAALAIFTGCEKEIEQDAHVPGTDIVFGASTSWRNDVQTRTEYSGKDQDDNSISTSSTHERIDWVADKDRIRIVCDAATGKVDVNNKVADYVIYNVRKGSDKKKSEADITSCDNNSLQWGTGTHVFYALYPAAGTESNYGFSSINNPVKEANSKIESISGTKAKISGTIPAAQEALLDGSIYKPNMNYAYMFATAKATANSTGNVLLSFDPLVTSLEFSLTKDSVDPVTANLTKVELSSTSTPLTGSFTATIDGNGSTPSVSVTAPDYSASNNKVTITLPSPGVALSDTPVKVTFLTLPVLQTNLTITLYFGSDSNKRTLKLNTASGPVSVGARKKAYFNFSVPNLAYILEVQGPQGTVNYTGGSKVYKVKSLKTSGSNPSVGVGWTAKFKVEGSSTWSSTKPSWLTVFTSRDDDGSVTFQEYTATLDENESRKVPKEWRGGTTPIGSESAPINLALRNVYGQWTGNNGVVVSSPEEAVLNTANCYVISDPGWYCFPVIYGNAYKNNDNNPSSYTSSATAVSPYGALGTFVNHLGNGITQGWIQNNAGLESILDGSKPLGVKLVWEDRQGLIDKTKLSHFLEAPTDPNSHSNMGRYVKFYIDPAKIFQGNAIIAFTVDGVVVWSWHIWVIEKEKVGTQTVYPGSSSVANPVKFMEHNLGWFDADYVTYPRSVDVQITQDVTGATRTFTIKQNAPMLKGGNVYYNWGRKDPMSGMKEDYTEMQTYGDMPWVIQVLPDDVGKTIADGIKNPNVFYATPGAAHTHRGSWCAPRYENLWNTSAGTKYNTDVAVTKSIYDPSPVGFKVPNRNVFNGFSATNVVGTWDGGWYFPSGSGSDTIFFPATFLRDFDSGEIDDWRRNGATFPDPIGTLEGYLGGYYWTAATFHKDDPGYWGASYLEIRDHSNFDPTPYVIPNTSLGPVGYGFSVRSVVE